VSLSAKCCRYEVPNDSFLNQVIGMGKHRRWGYSEYHLAGKRALNRGGAFAVFDTRHVLPALESQEQGELLLRQSPHSPMGAQIAQHCSLRVCHRPFVLLRLYVQKNHFIVAFLRGGNSMENVPTTSSRVDVGTRGRR